MDNVVDIRCNKDALVIQANELIRSKQDDLSLIEMKLIRLAISQIIELDTDFRTYTIQAKDLAEYLCMDKKTIYRDIEQMASSIMKKLIYLRDTKTPPKRSGEYNYEIFNWVDYFSYKNGVVTIRLNEKLKPMLLGLSEYFTKYGYKSIKELPSSNAIRLFELLASYENVVNPYIYHPEIKTPEIEKAENELIFSIDYLKAYFNCAEKYPNNSDFVKWIIKSSVLSINQKSETHKVSYRVAKKGRSIAYVLFKVNAWDDPEFMEFINAEG